MESVKLIKAPALFGLSAADVDAIAQRAAETGSVDSQAAIAKLYNTNEMAISKLYNSPAFITLVGAKAETVMQREGKPAAIRVLVDIAKDARQAPQHRIRAAELILSRTMAPAAPAPADGRDRDLAELSTDELRDLVDSMQRQLADRAAPVNAPDAAPKQIDGKAISADSVFDTNT